MDHLLSREKDLCTKIIFSMILKSINKKSHIFLLCLFSF